MSEDVHIYVGTLIGPEGQRVGRYVDFGDHHNEVQRLKWVDSVHRKSWNQLQAERQMLLCAIVDLADRTVLRTADSYRSIAMAAYEKVHAGPAENEPYYPYHLMPQDLIDKALEIRRWFDERHIKHWSIGGITSTDRGGA